MRDDVFKMTPARWTAAILASCVCGVLVLFELGVNPEPLSLWIVGLGAPATTLFVVLYGITVRWQDTWIGRALMVSSTGMAGLVDFALLNRILPPAYPFHQEILLVVLTFISAGGFLKLLALLRDKVPLWLGRRDRHVDWRGKDDD